MKVIRHQFQRTQNGAPVGIAYVLESPDESQEDRPPLAESNPGLVELVTAESERSAFTVHWGQHVANLLGRPIGPGDSLYRVIPPR